MPHLAVIGAGVTGITTAYALTERGYSVTVFDRQRYAAMEPPSPTAASCPPAMRRCGTPGARS